MKILESLLVFSWAAVRTVIVGPVVLVWLLVLVLTSKSFGATLYVINSGNNAVQRVLLRSWEGGDWSGSAWQPTWTVLQSSTIGGVSVIWKAEVPDGLYRIDLDYYNSDGSTVRFTKTDAVVSGTATIGVQYPRTFYVAQYANEHGTAVVPPDAPAVPFSDADAAQAFIAGVSLASTIRLFRAALRWFRRAGNTGGSVAD